MRNSKSAKKTVDKHIIKGSVTGVVVLAASIIIASAAILKTTPHNKYYLPILTLCLILSGVSSGLYASLNQKSKGLINGILASLLSAVAGLVAASIAEGKFNLINLIVPVIVIISGAFGGIAAINIKTKRKRR